MGHVLLDLDRSWAVYNSGDYHRFGPKVIGAPIPAMTAKVQALLEAGKEVRIFTARVNDVIFFNQAGLNSTEYLLDCEIRIAISTWCLEQIGRYLMITNSKTHEADELWDDRARQLIPNTGEFITDFPGLFDAW